MKRLTEHRNSIKISCLNHISFFFAIADHLEYSNSYNNCAHVLFVNIDSLDAVKGENSAHVLRKRVGIRPLKVVSNRNNVLLAFEGGDNLLQVTHTHYVSGLHLFMQSQ